MLEVKTLALGERLPDQVNLAGQPDPCLLRQVRDNSLRRFLVVRPGEDAPPTALPCRFLLRVLGQFPGQAVTFPGDDLGPRFRHVLGQLVNRDHTVHPGAGLQVVVIRPPTFGHHIGPGPGDPRQPLQPGAAACLPRPPDKQMEMPGSPALLLDDPESPGVRPGPDDSLPPGLQMNLTDRRIRLERRRIREGDE